MITGKMIILSCVILLEAQNLNNAISVIQSKVQEGTPKKANVPWGAER